MSQRADVSEERKAQILEAAAAVFARQGFDGARMDDIVAESGLSKGTLYWYFDGKDDIIAGILGQFFNREVKGLNEVLTADGSASTKLRLLARQVAADLDDMAPLLPISFEFYAIAGRNERVRQTLRGYFTQYRQGLSKLIQDGVTSGEFETDSSEAAATALIAELEGLVLLWLIDPEFFDFADQLDSAINLFIAGLKQRTRPK